MSANKKIESINKQFTNQIYDVLYPNAAYLENKGGPYVVRADGEKLYFPGAELFDSVVSNLAWPLLIWFLTDFLYNKYQKKQENKEINDLKAKLDEVIKLNRKKNAWFDSTNYKEIGNRKHLKTKITKFLQKNGWPTHDAELDADKLIENISKKKLKIK